MTTIAVLVDPPHAGVLPRLADTAPLSDAEIIDCYAALAKDVVTAVVRSGGELLVNYRPYESLDAAGEDAEADVRAALGDVVSEDARFEVQVGETFAGRAGNTATHLLERESVDSVAIVTPSSALLSRRLIDGAAMKLRNDESVFGPATRSRVYYAAFAEPIDFADAYAAPALETLVDRSLDAGHEVGFLEHLPVVETAGDLAAVVSLINARRRAGRIVPDHLAAWIDDVELRAEPRGDELALER